MMLEVLGEESPRGLALEEEGLELWDPRLFDEPRAVFIDQVVQLGGKLARAAGPACHTPVCHRATHAIEQRAVGCA